MVTEPRTDAELVAAWLGGEADALGAVYDRYGDALYAFALSRVRDPSVAADVVQMTFERAAGRLGQLREPDRLRPWLYAVARRLVFDHGRRPDRIADDEELMTMAAEDADPSPAVERAELAELVWAAADGLTDRDREVLALHLRHGLDGAELAEVIGVPASHAYVLVNRMKDRMAKAVGALLVARHGRADCAPLARLLAGWDGRFTLDVRSRVVRHVEGCDDCRRRRAALVAPDMLAAGALVAPVLAPRSLRAAVLERVAPSSPAGAIEWRPDGFPRQPSARPGRRLLVGAVAVAMVLIVAVVAGVALAGRDDADPVALAAPSSVGVAPLSDQTTAAVTANTSAAVPPPPSPTTAAISAAGTTAATSSTADSAAAPPSSTGPGVAPPSPSSVPSSSSPSSAAPPSVDTTAGGTATTPASPPAAPPAAPGQLVVVDTALDFGTTATRVTVRLRNDGGSPSSWSVATSSPALAASPVNGTVTAGGAASFVLVLDRAAAAEGISTFTAAVTAVAGGGGGTVVATARIERKPVIVRVDRSPATVRTATTCGPTLTTVTVEATDESGIATVEILWSADGSLATRTALAGDGRVFSGRIGSFTRAGTATLTAQVKDTRGNVATASTTVAVVAC